MINLGHIAVNGVARIDWETTDLSGAAVPRSTPGAIRIYKDGSTTERASTAGITDTVAFDGVTGNQRTEIDLSNNADVGFYAEGSEYAVKVIGAIANGITFNLTIARFRIGVAPADVTEVAGTPVSGVADFRATGFSTHSAADVWSSPTRALTDKTNFQLAADQAVNVTMVGGTPVSGPDDLKANVSALLTSSAFTAALPANFGTLAIDGSGRVTVGSILASVIEAIAVEVDARLLDAGDATDLIASIVTRIGNTNIDQAALVAAVKAALFDAGSAANKLAVDATGRVTVGSNADKTGYSLATAPLDATATQAAAAAALAAYDPPTRAEATADKDAILTQGNSAWATASGFATPANVTAAQSAITTAITASEGNIRGGSKTLANLSTEIATRSSHSANDVTGGRTVAAAEAALLTAIGDIEGGGGVGSGSGTEQVVVTVLNEDDDEVPNAAVVAKSAGVPQATGATDGEGMTEALNLNVGTYVLDVSADGYEMETEADVPDNRTLVVESGTVAKTVRLKLRVVPASTEPDTLTLEIYLLQRNEAGDGFEPAGAGVVVKAQITDSDQDGLGVVNPVLTATTGADSRAYFTDFPRSSRYKAWIDGATTLKKADRTADTGDSHELPFIVGEG